MSTSSIDQFIALIAQLRDPQTGCPWDLKQTFHTMIPCLLEESYEVVEAIEQNNMLNLKEELGDLLLQVVFLSQLAQEQQLFNFQEVVAEVSQKIIRRHPHVFGDKTAQTEEQALAHWNAIKSQEQKNTENNSLLDNLPLALPALMRAEKLQKRCAKVGFDWDNLPPVIAKIEEELGEVKQALAETNQQHLEEELGDLLFATVNLIRHAKLPAEQTLTKANNKFERRFRFVEKQAKQQGKALADCSLEEMDIWWEQAKSEAR